MARDRGEEIFANRVDYPLPAGVPAGSVSDYVFDIVLPPERKKGYGYYAGQFFARFYKQHRKHKVKSLEELISVLHSEVTQRGVQHIREVVIVCHANSQALLFPLLAGASTYRWINEDTLAHFQHRLDSDFPDLKIKRAAVIARLTAESWVTIRACNFGNSTRGLYSVYAFFGGHANVYAPKMYQVFHAYRLGPGRRFGTPAKLHAHLVHQHIYPKEVTPERRRAQIEELYEYELFSEPFKIGSRSTDAAAYDALLDSLNEQRLTPALQTKLAEMMKMYGVFGWTPSSSSRIDVAVVDKAWSLTDFLEHDGIKYTIVYQLYWPTDEPDETLYAQARLAFEDAKDPKDKKWGVILQLFLTEEQDGMLQGRLVQLAGYADGDQGNTRREHYDAVLAALNQSDKPALRTLLLTLGGIDIPQNPPFTKISPTAWKLDNYLIKLENPSTREGDRAHTLSVYVDMSRDEMAAHGLAYLAENGQNPDTPGTELAAYFDRFSLDDLASCVRYLRTPFKPGNSLYIHHATQAMTRKFEFERWQLHHMPDLTDPAAPPLINQDQWSLTYWEKQDQIESSYNFNFNGTWAEVKASTPTSDRFDHDLFDEDDLAARLGIEPDLADPGFESDSDEGEDFSWNAFEAAFAKKPVPADKGLFAEREPEPDCSDFAFAIDEFLALGDVDMARAEAILKTRKTANGDSAFDILKGVLGKYGFVRRLADWIGANDYWKLPWLPSSADGVMTQPINRVLAYELEHELSWWAETKGLVVARTTLLQAGLGVLWALNMTMVPAKMLLHVAEEWESADKQWNVLGQVTAIRQFLRRVADVTYRATSVPDLSAIDIKQSVKHMPAYKDYVFANDPYWVSHYFLEQFEDRGNYSTFILPGDALKEGYDLGERRVRFDLLGEIERHAEAAVDEALHAMGLDACKLNVLTQRGLFDRGAFEAQVIGQIAESLLKLVPRV